MHNNCIIWMITSSKHEQFHSFELIYIPSFQTIHKIQRNENTANKHVCWNDISEETSSHFLDIRLEYSLSIKASRVD